MSKKIIVVIFISFFCSLSLIAKTKKPEFYKPKYAKLNLSKDKKKMLTIVFGTTSKDNNDYKILYVATKLDGSLDNVKKFPGNVSYESHIFNSAKFPPFKLPPLYDKNAEHETKIWIEHWHNQKKIWARGEDARKRRAKRGKYVQHTDPTPQGEFYVTVKYKIRQGVTRWDYTIRRCINVSDSLENAPVCDFTEKASANLRIVDCKKSKNKKGCIVSLNYAGSESVSQNTDAFVDNNVHWLRGTIQPEADIIIKKTNGKRIDKFTRQLSKLEYNNLSGMSERKAKKAESAEFTTRILDEGGIIDVIIDAGPMFGVLKTSQSIDL